MSEAEDCASRKANQLVTLADVGERQKLTGSFVGSRPFGKGTTSSPASSPAPADKLWFFNGSLKEGSGEKH